MKRFFALIMALFLSFIAFIPMAQLAKAAGTISVVTDGKKVDFSVYGAQPEIVNGRTMVPIRAVVETLGAIVTMGSDSFTIMKGTKNIKIVWKSDTAYVNDQPVKLDVPAYIKDDRTFVPLRFVSEAFLSTVGYDPDKNIVVVDTFDPAGMIQTTVTKVVDGDTFHAMVNVKDETIRLIGVDTPETVKPNTPVQPYGPEASAYTHKMLEGKQVYLAFDVQQRDKYGRMLAYVYLKDGTFFNAELVKNGYARVETVPPNVKHADLFVALSKEARANHRGFWSLPEDPWAGGGTADLGGSSQSGNSGNNGNSGITDSNSGTTGKVSIDSVDLSGEVVLIRNVDSKDIDMTGWKLVSTEGNQTYHFPDGFKLKAGASVKIVSGPKAVDNPPGQLKWTSSYIWNNSGDTAVLYNAQGNEVSTK